MSYFNPRTPCGVRRGDVSNLDTFGLFQSTHPVWGATQSPEARQSSPSISIHAPRVGCDQAYLYWASNTPFHFNPRTPCGVRLRRYIDRKLEAGISIHAPRVGCDRGP